MTAPDQPGWRRVHRDVWIFESPRGRFGVIRVGVWYVAITSDGSTAGKRLTCRRARGLLPLDQRA